ncbi:4'-phosphopantetheinyl transferase superfamily protein [Desulfosporosinus fructosivorans]|uniref:4'-phosphopantetheinyl transferase superfamily protein n=1 Tax=Desulfosporosinus fructosivorans TaxID=2018669 RepID=A0A4Z0R812_9FIRM|nr:4'-phosphopantetheinyl transferase superfamily protein [Desulfosporosinus fructosivorans]TGE38958.1 4'-phosphopantetheinyl transferase superfamily protein [Desulfosporosinus fructosivorans]
MVYYFDEIESLDEKFLNRSKLLLSQERMMKVDRLGNNRDKILSILAYLLLLYGLKKEGRDTSLMEIRYNEYGKPFLWNTDSVCFNLSHCIEGAACVISTFEVGIDIQEIRPVNDSILKKVCSQTEIKTIKAAINMDAEFTRYWTMKESFLKAIGTGIINDLKIITFDEIGKNQAYRLGYNINTFSEKRFILAVCTKGNIRIDLEKVSLDCFNKEFANC